MRKKFLITAIIAVVFIILNINTSKAATYYKDGFSVTLPDEYDTVITDSASEIDKRTSDYTKEISFESEKYDWDIVIDNNYLDILAGTLSELGFDVKSKKLVEHDGSKGARVGLEVTYSGMGMYMTEYQFLSDNYLYTITFIAFDSNPISANFSSTVLKNFINTSYTILIICSYRQESFSLMFLFICICPKMCSSYFTVFFISSK